MGSRQREKSEMTKAELKDVMLRLFLEKGYEETSIKEIAEAAGYSVGSFYRHWTSKQHAFMEFWDAYVADFIRESVENAPADCAPAEMIAYLIRRSETFSKNEITIKLYATSRVLSALYAYESVGDWANRYTEMLRGYIRRTTGCTDEKRVTSTANILHVILDTHALQYSTVISPHYDIDNDTMQDCLTAILAGLSQGATTADKEPN